MKADVWENPKNEKSLDEAQTPLWFWNDKLDEKELDRQLNMQSEIGVTCTNPHARTNGGEGYIGGYLDEEWFQNIGHVLDYKVRNKEKMWLYDEIDWPAGTCNQTITRDERNREQYVVIEKIDVAAGTVFRAQLKDFEGHGLFGIKKGDDISNICWNVHILDSDGHEVDIAGQLIYDMFGPELEYRAKKDSTVFITKLHVDAYEHGGNEQVNYLDASVTKKFLNSTYELYANRYGDYFGETITTVFNDETRMCHPIAWCRDFADRFANRHGYDIRRCIYRLILPDEESGRIRCDYFDTLADLFQTNYFKVIHDWCQDHRLKLFAHLLGEETLLGHVRYSGDYMRQNRYQDVCGADHLGKGIGSLNIKFTSAAAHSYGKERTAVEVFAGCGWDMTFLEYTRMVTWMFQQGMQTIINHGFFYSDRGERKNDWPPSQFFQWKEWDKQSLGNDMIRRMHYGLTDGMNEMDILVYVPTETFWYHYIPDQHFTHGFFHGAFSRGEQAAVLDEKFQFLLNTLSCKNMDFDLIHNDAVENFCVKDGKILNRLTGQAFSVLLLPMCHVLPVKMAELCREFCMAQGKLLCIDQIPALALDRKNDGQLEQCMAAIRKTESYTFCEMSDIEKIIRKINASIPHPIKIVSGTGVTQNNHMTYPAYLIDPYMHGGEDLSGVLFSRYIKDGRRNTLFMNYGRSEETIDVFVEGSSTPEIWDLMTGTISPAPVIASGDGGVTIRLTLPVDRGMFVVSDMNVGGENV